MKSDKINILKRCSYCKSELKTLINLGSLPPVNVMDKVDEAFYGYQAFPLTWAVCKECALVQILEELSGDSVFPESYPYLSGTTRILRENFKEQYTEVHSFLGLTSENLVVDIGSNDGTLLSNYKSTSKILGVEPTNAADVALSQEIPTLKKFFSGQIAQQILVEHGKAKVITACNVFAHIPDLSALMEGIENLLDDNGVFVSESHYIYSLIETLQFDTIYHEHYSYLSVSALTPLFAKYGLKIVDIEKLLTHGGSLRLYVAKNSSSWNVHDSVQKIVEKESQYDPRKKEVYGALQENTKKIKTNLLSILKKYKRDGLKISAYGAAAKGVTLLNYCNISTDLIDYVYLGP